MEINQEVTPDTIALPGAFPWWSGLVWGICTLIIGLLLLTTPVMTTLALITFIGAWWFVGGIFSLVSLAVDQSNFALKCITGLLSLLAGIAVLGYPLFSTIIILPMFVIFIGVWGIITGGALMYHGYTSQDWGSVIVGLVSVIFGILLLVYPMEAALTLPIVAGVFALVGGISAIIGSIQLKKIQSS